MAGLCSDRSLYGDFAGTGKASGLVYGTGYKGQASGLDRLLGPVERLIYRLGGIQVEAEMGWKTYAMAMLLCNCRLSSRSSLPSAWVG